MVMIVLILFILLCTWFYISYGLVWPDWIPANNYQTMISESRMWMSNYFFTKNKINGISFKFFDSLFNCHILNGWSLTFCRGNPLCSLPGLVTILNKTFDIKKGSIFSPLSLFCNDNIVYNIWCKWSIWCSV